MPETPSLPPFDLGHNSAQWTFIEGKTGGANKAGSAGGKYYITSSKKKVYLKQDPIQEKNICEVFASQFMRFIATEIGEDPNLIANVSFQNISELNGGSDIYIYSELYGDYCDLFLDAHLALELPAYEALRPEVSKNLTQLPKKRPNYFQSDPAVNLMLKSGRYESVIPGLALRVIIDDPDSHFENIGVTPKKPITSDLIPLFENGKYTGKILTTKPISKKIEVINGYYVSEKPGTEIEEFLSFDEICIKKGDKYFFVPNIKNTQTVQIDFGGALGDFRFPKQRKFDGKIHLSKFMNFFRYSLSPHAPPSYTNKIPDELIQGSEFFSTLAAYSMIDPKKISAKVNSEVDKIFAVYAAQPKILAKFAERIGVELQPKNLSNLQIKDKIKTHLISCFFDRQTHAKQLYLNYLCSLNSNQFKLAKFASKKTSAPASLEKFFAEKKDHNLIASLDEVGDLQFKKIEKCETLNIYLYNLKNQFHSEITTAYKKHILDKKIPAFKEKISETAKLLKDFHLSYQGLVATSNKEEQAKILVKFIEKASEYEEIIIKPSKIKKFILTASEFIGALIGSLFGICLGLGYGMIMAFTTIPLNFFKPNLGLNSIFLTIKNFGLTFFTSSSVCAYLIGKRSSECMGKFSNYILSSKTDLAIQKLCKNLTEELSEAKLASNDEPELKF